jgi:hypothetical protein
LDQVKSLKAVAFPSVQPSTRNCHDSGHYKRPLFKRASPWERIGQNKGRRPQPLIIQKTQTEAVTLELNNNYMCKPLNDFKMQIKKNNLKSNCVTWIAIADMGMTPVSAILRPAGRLRHFIMNSSYWHSIGGSCTEFATQLHQYKLPHPTYLNLSKQQLVKQETNDLCLKGRSTICHRQLPVHPFSHSEKGQASQQCKGPEHLCDHTTFHNGGYMEGIHILLQKGDWLVKK